MTTRIGGVLRTSAPAKLNLGLRVTARRTDGYHELRSVFLRLDLADEVVLTDAPGDTDVLTIEGDPDCPVAGNLVLDAARAMRAVAPDIGPVAIRLRKRIPMFAGLAGGSSDAAAILRLLAHRMRGTFDDAALPRIAVSLGSDVPFFLAAPGAAVVEGVGERIEPLPPPIEPLGILLVKPPVGLATDRVFGAWDELHTADLAAPGDPDVCHQLATELRAGATPEVLVGLAPRLRDANDLWPAAVMVQPRMGRVREVLEARLRRPVLMTGSGSTLFVTYASADEAAEVARQLVDERPPALQDAWVEATASGTPYPPEVVIEEGRP